MSAPSNGRLDALTARDEGLVACTRCTRVWPIGRARCGRCEAPLASRDAASLAKVWAFLAAGMITYVPANTLPMLSTSALFEHHTATIVGGAIELAEAGVLWVAIVIIVASVGIPIAKFVAIGWLALAVRPGSGVGRRTSQHTQLVLYEIVEYIGRWSMIDVFVVAVLSALVHLGLIVSIEPGPAALAFAASVILTMLAAQAFDSRLIWDRIEAAGERPAPDTAADAAPDAAADGAP